MKSYILFQLYIYYRIRLLRVGSARFVSLDKIQSMTVTISRSLHISRVVAAIQNKQDAQLVPQHGGHHSQVMVEGSKTKYLAYLSYSIQKDRRFQGTCAVDVACDIQTDKAVFSMEADT